MIGFLVCLTLKLKIFNWSSIFLCVLQCIIVSRVASFKLCCSHLRRNDASLMRITHTTSVPPHSHPAHLLLAPHLSQILPSSPADCSPSTPIVTRHCRHRHMKSGVNPLPQNVRWARFIKANRNPRRSCGKFTTWKLKTTPAESAMYREYINILRGM